MSRGVRHTVPEHGDGLFVRFPATRTRQTDLTEGHPVRLVALSAHQSGTLVGRNPRVVQELVGARDTGRAIPGAWDMDRDLAVAPAVGRGRVADTGIEATVGGRDGEGVRGEPGLGLNLGKRGEAQGGDESDSLHDWMVAGIVEGGVVFLMRC